MANKYTLLIQNGVAAREVSCAYGAFSHAFREMTSDRSKIPKIAKRQARAINATYRRYVQLDETGFKYTKPHDYAVITCIRSSKELTRADASPDDISSHKASKYPDLNIVRVMGPLYENLSDDILEFLKSKEDLRKSHLTSGMYTIIAVDDSDLTWLILSGMHVDKVPGALPLDANLIARYTSGAEIVKVENQCWAGNNRTERYV